MSTVAKPQRANSVSSTLGLERWVAVVDDDEFVRRSLARLLRANGIVAQTFQSAQEYLSSTPTTGPACIILDVHLRDVMTGMELRERLSAQGSLPPIIFITGQDAQELGPGLPGLGNSAILRKQFDPTVLLDLVLQRVGLGPANGTV